MKYYNIMRYMLLIVILFSCNFLYAKGIYQTNNDFLQDVFNGSVPKPQLLWLTGSVKKNVKSILGENISQLRVRYWQDQKKSAWILEELGKEKLITVGIVIKDNEIQRLKVLAFRESRGWEVKETFFTDQFHQIRITPELKLNRSIDGISGATLSVRALKKLARLALYYQTQIMLKKKT